MLPIPCFGSIGVQSSSAARCAGGFLSGPRSTPFGAAPGSGRRGFSGQGCGPPGSGTTQLDGATEPSASVGETASVPLLPFDVHATAMTPRTATMAIRRRVGTDRPVRIVRGSG